MPRLVKLDSEISDDWSLIEIDAGLPTDLGKVLLPLSTYLNASDLPKGVGVWLDSAEDVNALAPYLENIPVIACRFVAFADGRSFSQARILREHLDYKGEIRAVGSYIQDQLFYLMRCGFSEFSVDDGADMSSLQESLKDFSESYQAACDLPEPLFRRRA